MFKNENESVDFLCSIFTIVLNAITKIVYSVTSPSHPSNSDTL